MIINCNRDYFLCIFLPYHIIIQFCFDLMRCRKILDIDQRLSLFPFFFLLQLLFLRNHLFQIRHIHNLDSRHIHKLAVINISIIHSVKALLHTVTAHRNMIRKVYHLSRHTLRTSANKTHLFVFVILLI